MYRISAAISLLALLMLQGCGGSPPVEQAAPPAPPPEEPVPEITLNLPSEDCACPQEQQIDYTFLEKGFRALHDGDYLESLRYFQRYERIESSPVAKYEARTAIAYLSILPDSPIYDSRDVERRYPSLRNSRNPDWRVHDQILLMEETLAGFLDMQRQINRLQQSNRAMREEVEQKESAIKKLRDLMLGRESEPGG